MPPKQPPADIDEDDLNEFLKTQDSFAFELRLLKYAKGQGMVVEHGGSYVDPSTQKHRQFDIRATMKRPKAGQAIAFAIECKCLQKTFPLLISCVPRAPRESFQTIVGVNLTIQLPVGIRRSGLDCIYPPIEPVGKSMTQVGRNLNGSGWTTNGESDAYEKWSQALQSSAQLFDQGLRGPDRTDRTAVIPSLVVSDDTLWAVDYSLDGAQTHAPRRVDEITFFVDRSFKTQCGPVPEIPVSHLHIFTEKGLKARLRNLAEYDDWWDRSFLGS